MSKKMKQFIMALLVLVMSVSILAVPAAAATEPLTAKVEVEVRIDGYKPAQNDTYKILVTPGSSGFPMPSGGSNGIYEIQGVGSRELEFTFPGLGVYKYTITQVECANDDCYEDDAIYDLTVYVLNAEKPTDNKRFDVIATLKLRGGNDADKPQKALFVNKYAEPAKVNFSATKIYNNKTPKTKLFYFDLKDSSGKILESVYNVGRDVIFSPVVYDEVGTYTYTISEEIGKRPGVVYDKSIYTVTVTVTRDVENEGNYEAAVTYKKGARPCDAEDLVFVNKSITAGNPFTGDQFRMILWLSIMAISLVALVVVVIVWIKNRKK